MHAHGEDRVAVVSFLRKKKRLDVLSRWCLIEGTLALGTIIGMTLRGLIALQRFFDCCPRTTFCLSEHTQKILKTNNEVNEPTPCECGSSEL